MFADDLTGAPAAPDTAPVLVDDAALERYATSYASGEDAPAGVRVTGKDWRESVGAGTEASAFARAVRFGLPLVRLDRLRIDPAALARVAPAVARRFTLVPVALRDDLLLVAVEDPSDPELLPTLGVVVGGRIALLVAEGSQLRAAIATHYDRIEDATLARSLGLAFADESEASEQQARRLAEQQPIVRMVDEMLTDAARRRASDVHLRPTAAGLELLYRIDDELLPVRRFLRALQPALVSRIKVLAGMNVAEHRLPQDGRATHRAEGGHAIDLRVSLLPTIHGESVVVRLLDTFEGLRSIDQLGLTPQDARRFGDLMSRSHGMILVTGPTGSGKTTTLYAALLEAREERVNIVTVEDPVEYHVDGVQQMQVNRAAGFTFGSALRNILRHDPDVIMVGEVRDRETAQVAVESALTGHLLLSTLHTNTAATAITRLLDLGVEAFLLRSTLLAVASQRLARRNCPHCSEPENVPPHWRELLGVGPDEVFRRGSGCRRCDGLGIHGRVAVYELLTVTATIRRLITPHCEADAVHDAAIAEGMVPLTQHAVQLARAGTISLSEAWRLRTV